MSLPGFEGFLLLKRGAEPRWPLRVFGKRLLDVGQGDGRGGAQGTRKGLEQGKDEERELRCVPVQGFCGTSAEPALGVAALMGTELVGKEIYK